MAKKWSGREGTLSEEWKGGGSPIPGRAQGAFFRSLIKILPELKAFPGTPSSMKTMTVPNLSGHCQEAATVKILSTSGFPIPHRT